MRRFYAIVFLAAFLFIDARVSALQFDLDTTGSITSLVPDKRISTNRLPNGKLRVVMYGMNVTTFTGKFAVVNADALGITGVIGASPEGNPVSVNVTATNEPKGLRISQ